MAIQQLDDGRSDGSNFGNNAPNNTGSPKISFFGGQSTTGGPVALQTPGGNTHTVTAGATTSVFTNTTFDGSIGSTAYTVGDIVAVLKVLGLLKA